MTDLNTEETTTTTEAATPAAPEPSVQDKALAAIDLGMTEEVVADEPVVVDGEDVPAVDPAADKPAPDAEPAKDAKPEPKDVEAEIAELGIKIPKTADRFREMAGEIKTFHTALEAVGIKDVAELPQLVEAARMGQEIVSDWASLDVSPEAYAGYLSYAQQIKAIQSGDVKAAESAFATIENEYLALARFLGKDVAGAEDVLAAHPDLQAEVEAGDISRKRALELAATRTQTAARQTVQQAQSETTQAQQAIKVGENALVAWEQNKIATDPTYMAKREALSQQVAVIRESMPPDKWAAATERLYAALPAPAAPAPAAKPTPGPVRPGRTTAPMLRENASALEAIDFALDNR